MKKIIVLAAATLALLSSVSLAADWDHRTAGEALDKIKAGKTRVDLRNDYPEDQVHLVSFDVAPNKLNYLIDVKARLCYLRWTAGPNAVSMTQVPCKSVKEGYPIMAPIIDWEK